MHLRETEVRELASKLAVFNQDFQPGAACDSELTPGDVVLHDANGDVVGEIRWVSSWGEYAFAYGDSQ